MSGKEPEAAKDKVYLDERRALIDAEYKSTEQFDNGILTLAAGALGISIVFIEKIAPHPEPATIWLLRWAWGGFVASLLCTMSSFLTSVHAHRRQSKILDDLYEKKDVLDRTQVNQRNLFSWVTKSLNWVSIVSFITGAVFLVCFSIMNLNYKGDADAKSPTTTNTTTTTTVTTTTKPAK